MISPGFFTPDWPAPDNIRAASTTRTGGVSLAAYASLNLGSHVGDAPEAVAENRLRLQAALQLPESPIWLTQVHGTDVLCLDGLVPANASLEYDACYSSQPGKVCAVMTADCLPVLFCSRDGMAVAAAHAGWRGLVGGVLAATVNRFSVPPGQIVAWLGPAIGPASFEVGPDVYRQFTERWQVYGTNAVQDCFVSQGRDRWLCDLYALARLQLGCLGIDAVHGGDQDTFADRPRFYSFRRDGCTGRMASLIWRTV